MGWAMCLGVVVWFVNWSFSSDRNDTIAGSEWLKTLVDTLSILALIPLAYFAFRAMRWIFRHLLWRLRQRLIVTYFLIGVLPLVLVLVLVLICGYALLLQSGSTLAARQMDGYIAQSRAAAEAISRDLTGGTMSRASAADLQAEMQDHARELAAIFPGVVLTVRRADGIAATGRGNDSARSREIPGASANDLTWPAWLKTDFHGLAVESRLNGTHYALVRHLLRPGENRQTIFEFSYPVSPQLSAQISQAAGVRVEPINDAWRLPRNQEERTPAPDDGYPVLMAATEWDSGMQEQYAPLALRATPLWPGEILEQLRRFIAENELNQIFAFLIALVALLFLFITILAVISAGVLTRSITSAVHQLYQGTKRVEAGDLNHEIPVHSHDQLGELATSFNQMTGSIRQLLRVSAEKQRLEQEMSLAAEVQARLFPRTLPSSRLLDIAPGICIPARSVSGDYYDFMNIAPGVTSIVVADVCGKGMSAALLMSNLQASLRGQAQAYHDAYQASSGSADVKSATATEQGNAAAGSLSEKSSPNVETVPPRHALRQIVERVNHQVVNSTADWRYVTMFYAEFDEQTSTLHYINAGHNPPLLLRAVPTGNVGVARVERLDAGGTVLGLFDETEYADQETLLESGDLLVAYTDGLIEAHNAAGEEFGEERLAQSLEKFAQHSAAEIERLLLQSIRQWTGGRDQEDDLTLVVLKRK
jgi:sigma-B regulation protein RsbU (phosphoserine phosphatase)